MTWLVVAKKDFRDALRSRWLLWLAVAFTVLVSGSAALFGFMSRYAPGLLMQVWGFQLLFAGFGEVGQDGEAVFELTSSLLVYLLNGNVVTWFLPIIAIVMAHNAVVSERDSGSLKVLLSLPHSRADVVFGKMLGRTGAIVGPQILGFLLPGVVLAFFVPFDALEYFGFVLLTGLLTMTFVSIAVGISASLRSRQRVLLANIGVYGLFVTVWGTLKLPVQFLIDPRNPGRHNWPDYLSWVPLSPGTAVRVMELVNPTGAFKALSTPLLSGNLFAAGADPNRQFAAVAMLVFWVVFPMLVGIWRFEEVDL